MPIRIWFSISEKLGLVQFPAADGEGWISHVLENKTLAEMRAFVWEKLSGDPGKWEVTVEIET